MTHTKVKQTGQDLFAVKTWALRDARARLSELIRAAQKEPQVITLRGVPTVEVRPVKSKAKPSHKPMTLLEALQACPYELEIPKRKGRMRPVDL